LIIAYKDNYSGWQRQELFMNIKAHSIALITLFSAFFSVDLQAVVYKDVKQVKRGISTTISIVFPADQNTIFDEPLKDQPLRNFLVDLDKYIDGKITVKLLGKDKDIAASYTKIKGAILKLINGIKLYNTYIFRANKSAEVQKDMENIKDSIEDTMKLFNAERTNLKRILGKTIFSDKKEAINVLIYFAQQFEEIAASALIDTELVALNALEL
jgi:hypothetical protein